jgi:DNA invertase Pin-like site-specific DNA recombinase
MNAAIYIRKSRENDDKPSYRLTVQREQLPEYARSRGWIPSIYDDGHASAARGKACMLPERTRLEQDIRAGKIQIILVIELSRLSRDESMQDYVAWLTLCADHGVQLATLSRTLDPSQHSDWMLLLMEGGFSSVEMKVLTARMAEGRRQAFLAGKFLGGQCPQPYTYDKGLGKPVINERMLADITVVWKLAEEMSAKAIAERLHLAEITVRRMISDDRLLFYQALRVDPETGNTIQCDWDAVMSAARAERIRSSRRTRKTNTVRRDAAGLLSALGIFYCGYCKKTVKSWNNSKTRLDGSRLDYYACVTKNKKGACPQSKMINHQTVNEKVVKNMLSTLGQGDLLSTWWREAQLAKKQNTSAGEILVKIRHEETKKKNLVDAIASGLIDFSDAKTQMEDIKGNLARLQDFLDQIETSNVDEPDWESIKCTREEFEVLSLDEQRDVIRSAIGSITLYNTYAIIKYLFPRSKAGSYEARINLARGTDGKVKNKKRTKA